MQAAAALTGESPRSAAVEVKGVAKAFGETQALAGCDLRATPGTVHAILGENGSGKSTLVKVLSGVLAPDRGSLHVDGTPVRRFTPRALRKAGVATVFQEVLNAPSRSVLENLFLGYDSVLRSRTAARRERREVAHRTLTRIASTDIDLDRSVEHLPLSQRQLVTIGRALIGEPRILILDEATSALGAGDRAKLFDTVGELTGAGCLVIYITHRMDEVLDLADVATVLRNGRSVATLPREEISVSRVLSLMSPRSDGADLAKERPGRGSAPTRSRSSAVPMVLRAAGLRLRGEASPVDLEVRRGEIVGLVGLDGHGQEDFIETLAGLRSAAPGDLVSNHAGDRCSIDSPRSAAAAGIAYLPRDRAREGIFAPLSILDNFSVVAMRGNARMGLLRRGALRRAYAGFADLLSISGGSIRSPITSLSGGSQQKVLLARWLATRPSVLLLNDPTRGVDLPTRHALHDRLRELAREPGMAVVLLSTDPDELVALCDRVLVFLRGSVFTELTGAELTAPRIVAGLFGETQHG